MSATQWDQRAARLLREASVPRVPVDVVGVARHLGVEVTPYDLGADVSGLLVQEGGRAVIGVNSKQAPVRQRFTIAHELGHFVLHRRDSSLFVDHQYVVAFRNRKSETGADLRERQANAFAASLLMPRTEVIQHARRLGYDLGDDGALRALADRFEVSQQAMSYRLAHLVDDIPDYP